MSEYLPIVNSYPPYELHDVIKNKDVDTINVYLDLKNASTGLFIQEIVENLVTTNRHLPKYDTRIFQSVIYFCSMWKSYCNDKGYRCRIFINTDFGDSCYHKAIDKDYKKSRKIGSSCIVGEYDVELLDLKRKNFDISERILNLLNGVYLFYLKFLETDFIPYYLITRKYKDEEKTLHVICSNDKDMYQALINDNVIQVFNVRGNKSVINRNSTLTTYSKISKDTPKNKLKYMDCIKNINPDYISAIMACVGDSGDDVKGIKRFGAKSGIKLFSNTDEVKRFIGTCDELIDRVSSGGKFLKEDISEQDIKTSEGNWINIYENNDLVTNAYKLISFECLSRWLEENNKTEKIEYRRYIDNILSKEKTIDDFQLFWNSINKSLCDICLEKDNFKILFS